jgi:uncharacterized repeat protein (TIGR02543 family)
LIIILLISTYEVNLVKGEGGIFKSVNITIIDRYEGKWRYDILTNVPAKLTFYLYDEHKNLVHVYEEPWYSSEHGGIFGGYIPPGTKGTLRIKAEDEHGNIEWWEGVVDLSFPFTTPVKITTIIDLPPEFEGRIEVNALCTMPNPKEYRITVSVKNIGDQPVVFSLQYILKTERGEILFIEKDKPWLEHKEPLLPGEEARFESHTGGYWQVPPDADPTRWTMTVRILAYFMPPKKTLSIKAAELAKEVIGAVYQWGAKGYSWDKRRFVDPEEILMSGYGWNWRNPKEYGAGLDCSGLVFWAYNKAAGITNYRDSLVPEGAHGQWEASIKIDKAELKPGDLLFFDEYPVGDGRMDHVAIYVGPFSYEGKTYNVIHASRFANQITPAYYDKERNVLITVKATGESQILDVDGYGRVRDAPAPVNMKIIAKSPINLVVTDPENITVSKEAPEATGMFYIESDIDGDGKLDDVVNVWERKIGNYSIKVIPETNASLSDTYTLEVSSNGITIALAENIQLINIPTKPYIVRITKTEITPLYSLTIKTEPLNIVTILGEGVYERGTKVLLDSPQVVDGKEGVRYVFERWSVNGQTHLNNSIYILMDSPHVVVAKYKTQYYLRIESQYGDPRGEGWYDAGSIAIFSITSPVGFIVQHVFTGWSGDSTATTINATIIMDRPKKLVANWRTDYTQLYMLIGAVIILVAIFLFVKWKRQAVYFRNLKVGSIFSSIFKSFLNSSSVMIRFVLVCISREISAILKVSGSNKRYVRVLLDTFVSLL